MLISKLLLKFLSKNSLDKIYILYYNDSINLIDNRFII